MNKIRLYPRGFVFSEKAYNIQLKHYKCNKIVDTYYYYYDYVSENPNIYISDSKEEFIILHGHYYAADNILLNNKFSLKELLYNFYNNRDLFLDTIDFIGGRYVIIIGNKENVYFFQDSTGMRTVYYSLKENIVSSHVHHINDIVPHELNNIDADGIFKSEYLWDYTPYTDIKSLNPNLYLDFKFKKKFRFFPRQNNKFNTYTEEEKFEIIENLWKGQLKYYVDNNPNLVFSLTGGGDSRVLLAMAKEYLSKIKTFTYATERGDIDENSKFAKILKLDHLIVEQMIQDIDINHRFFFIKEQFKEFTHNEINILDKNNIRPHGRELLLFYNDAFPEKDVMHMRGNLLEIGRAYFIKDTSKNDTSDLRNIVNSQMRKHFNTLKETEEILEKFFIKAVESLCYNQNLYDYHILDLYYWEIRMGRWGAEVLNETDASFETFLPFNIRAMIDVTLSFPVELRKNNYVFTELINRNYPVLNFYGKNTTLNLYEQLKIKNKFSPTTNEITIYDSDNNEIEKINLSNQVYLPSKYILKGYYADIELTFRIKRGIANIILENRYSNKNGSNYLKYQVIVNDIVVLEEDIAKWKFENHVTLINLNKNDLIKIRVISMRDTPRDSWSKASRVHIKDYNEVPYDNEGNLDVTCTSPMSIKMI